MSIRGTRWRTAARLGGRYLAFRLRTPRRRRWTIARRLETIPTDGLPVGAPVEIRWNDRQVPWVAAESHRDLAVGLGVVHGHLRLFQIEMMRRLAWGRLAEIAGPIALDLDRSLRIIGFARAVPAIEAMLPDETREWLEGFRDGINAVIDAPGLDPEEFRLLGIRPEPWSVADLIAIGRLAASDFSWKVLARLLRHSRRPDWPDWWQILLSEGAPTPSFSSQSDDESMEMAFSALNRGGSNSLAVGAARSASGGAMIASDPHLGVMLPNSWLVAGMRAPGLHAVGLMIPGIPVVALGRNADIAWGGTSLHAASSDLFDVSDLPDDEITVREEAIPVRWGDAASVTIRETALGPIVSDAPMLGLDPDRPLAMRWIGHDPNDEITAMLGVARAHDWGEFRAALDGFAAPAQTMVYADTDGHVGRTVAAHLPRRPSGPPADIVQPREYESHWRETVKGSDFPSSFAPEDGFVASANNRPPPSEVPAGFFFSPDDRVERMAALLNGEKSVTAETLEALQRDVEMPSARKLADGIIPLFEHATERSAALDLLRGWDGRHEANSRGALAFELAVYHLLHALHATEDLDLYLSSWDLYALLIRDLDRLPRDRLRDAAALALMPLEADLERYRDWGTVHRLRLEHPFARIPVAGRAYRFGDEPVGGGNETLMKTAHGVSRGVHRVGLGAVARHISDLADPDANDFCLLGGQDGWLGSDNFNDQSALWRAGDYVRVPMTRAAVEADFPHVTRLAPGAPIGEGK